MLAHHQHLLPEACKHNVFVYIEHHKPFDPAYADARNRAKTLGNFNYLYSYMSQPMSQLETFKACAGKDSDISNHLNSHHVDICASIVPDYTPVVVKASGSAGTAGCAAGTEDTACGMGQAGRAWQESYSSIYGKSYRAAKGCCTLKSELSL